jgi:hypothetical protein
MLLQAMALGEEGALPVPLLVLGGCRGCRGSKSRMELHFFRIGSFSLKMLTSTDYKRK